MKNIYDYPVNECKKKFEEIIESLPTDRGFAEEEEK